MQSWGIVDTIAHVANHMFGLAQSEDNSFFLVRIYCCKDVRALSGMPQGFIGHVVQSVASQQAQDWQMHSLGNMSRHFLVVAGDNFELYTTLRQINDGFLDICFRRIEE